ncbi:MAG: hypothetical protein A2Y89_03155 [Chloroflexi bacterium RBG_13_51_18]|nr:MAG: hypothetical protein A2Y89_03155 [Chloroflexi bacterium RBG_13_51_18]
MNIRILGAHNSESSSSSCVTFIIDDKLAVEAGGLTAHLSISEQRDIEAVILTHHHMDHVRDIPTMAYNFYNAGVHLNIYAMAVVNEVIRTHLLNALIYPEFQKIPEGQPIVRFMPVEPYEEQWINGFTILPVPVRHAAASVGYQISDTHGIAIFYTGDTGPDLAECWRHISPQLLMIDVTMPDGHEDFVVKTGHLTPRLLERELISFRDIKGYLPRVVAIHIDASHETEIREGLALVGEHLSIPIDVAYEGMLLEL